MISMTHILVVVFVLLLLFGSTKISTIGSALGTSVRDFKKALKGEEDIDVTHSAKRLPPDDKA